MKNIIWIIALLTASVASPVSIAQEDRPDFRPPEAERFQAEVREKRYQAALGDLRARVEALEKAIARKNSPEMDRPPKQLKQRREFNRPAPADKWQPERGRFNPQLAPGPERRGPVVSPMPPLDLPPEQREKLRNRLAEVREHQNALREKLAATRQSLQEAVNEQPVNEEAIQDLAQRLGKIEVELALTRTKVMRELKDKLPPEKFEQLKPYLKRGLEGEPFRQPPVLQEESRRPQPQARLDRRPYGSPREDAPWGQPWR